MGNWETGKNGADALSACLNVQFLSMGIRTCLHILAVAAEVVEVEMEVEGAPEKLKSVRMVVDSCEYMYFHSGREYQQRRGKPVIDQESSALL